MVQVVGAQDEAFLYDMTGKAPAFIKYLDKDVTNVRFTAAAGGHVIEINMQDGHIERFDYKGNHIGSQYPSTRKTF